MARSNIPSPDEALAGMARIGAPRQPVGNAVYSSVEHFTAADATNTMLVPRRNVQAGDLAGPAGARVYGSLNRNGARYGIGVGYSAPISHEASATQANGRVFKSAVNRDRTNFDMGFSTSMV